jgi:flagella basal body P-ring formation protein FlgA
MVKKAALLVLFCEFFLFPVPGSGQTGKKVLDDDILRQRIEMYVLKNYKENHDDVVIEVDSLPPAIEVDPIDWNILVRSRYGGIKNGSNMLEVLVFSRNQMYRKLLVPVKVRVFDDVVVATRLINRGERISGADIELRRVETTFLRQPFLTDTSEVIGMQARQVIAAGKPILAKMLELPDLIRRGELVKIVVRIKNLEVTATGRALENGRKGERITVQNLDTGKRLNGVVIDEKTVLVEL